MYLFCTDFLATLSEISLNQLLQQKLRKFLVCFCVFAGVAESTSRQKVKIRFCLRAGSEN